MKTHTKIILSIIFPLLVACDSEEDSARTYITLINDSETTLRGLQGFLGSDPTIYETGFDNIPAGEEATVQFGFDCNRDWQLRARLDGFFIFYNYSDYAESRVPCNQTTTCILNADESFSCDK